MQRQSFLAGANQVPAAERQHLLICCPTQSERKLKNVFFKSHISKGFSQKD